MRFPSNQWIIPLMDSKLVDIIGTLLMTLMSYLMTLFQGGDWLEKVGLWGMTLKSILSLVLSCHFLCFWAAMR
jgi:hypothetical protein